MGLPSGPYCLKGPGRPLAGGAGPGQKKKSTVNHVLSHFRCVGFCDAIDCSPPDSSVHGILQARILE